MSPMNQHKICCNANEMVPTSQADKIKLIDTVSTVRKPHLNSQGPVTIEIALMMMSPELMSDNSSGLVNCNTSISGVKFRSVDTACMNSVLATQGPFVYVPDPLLLTDNGYTDPESDGALQINMPDVPAVDDSQTEPESLEAMPTAIKKTTSDTPIFSLQTQVPGPSLRCTFTLDSFAGSETFDTSSAIPIKQELLEHTKEFYAKSNLLADAPLPDHDEPSYVDGFWSYPNFKINEPCEAEVPEGISHSRFDEDDPDLFFVDEEV
ncbi:hypothetical protein EDD17DRAFT_1751009 [Pisolithus thermaeus]|nr:hypothetical protein EDD17DRAFT_1751009 [Pisolithus thermaeus]